MAVNIILTVAGQGSGSGGESREFAYSLIDPTPPLTTLSLDDVTGVTSYLWEILNQPIGASASLSSSSAASPTFTPTATAWGTYLIRCTIIRNSVQEIGTVALSFWTPIKDMRFPAAGEKTEFSTTNGWMEAEHDFYEIVDNLSMTGYWSRNSTRLHPLYTGDTLQVGQGNISYPSYAYESDPDCGRYLYGTGIEAFACSGNAQILFGSDGNPYIKAVDGHNILTIGNYKTIGGGEAELLIEADGNATTDGAIINFNAKSTSTKTSVINILSDSDNGITDLNLSSDCGTTGTSSDVDITAYGGDATINITAIQTGSNNAAINIVSNKDIAISATESLTLYSDVNKASLVLYPSTNGEIRFSSNYIYTNWTNKYITLSDSAAEETTYTSNFGQISIFAALNYLYSSGGGGGGVTLDGAYDFGGSGAGRIITADSGAISISVPNSSGNSALSITQNDTTNNPISLLIDNSGTGNPITLDGSGTLSIYATDNLGVISAAELHFTDVHTEGGGSTWGWSYMPFSEDDNEWSIARALLGDSEGSLLALIAAAAAYGSGGLDEAYDFGGAGVGKSVTVDSGSISFSVPSSGTNGALDLSNLESTNTNELLGIYNDAALSTGYSIFIQGDAGGTETDYNELGHQIWSPDSLTIGHGDDTDGASNSRSYTNYHFREVDVAPWCSATMRAESGSSWADYAYVRVYSSSTPAIQLSTTGTINIYDGYESGSTWTGSSMAWSSSSASWTSIQALITAQGTEQSLFGAILAAAATGGGGSVSRPDTEILWGTGSGYSSEGNFTYNDAYNQLRIINNNSLTNWYDTNAASILLQGTATQGNAVVANGDLILGSLHSTVDNTTTLVAKNDGAYVPTVQISALPTSGNIGGVVNILADHNGTITNGSIEIRTLGYGGEGSGSGVIDIISESESSGFGNYNSEINLRIKNTSTDYGLSIDGTGATTVLATFDCPVQFDAGADFNDTYVSNFKAVDYSTSYSNTVVTNAFTFDPDNGINQRVSFSANTTWSLTTPAGCTRTTLWVKNTGGSAYTLTLTGGPTVTWFGGETDGFSIPASSDAVVTIIYDTTNSWAIGVSQEYV